VFERVGAAHHVHLGGRFRPRAVGPVELAAPRPQRRHRGAHRVGPVHRRDEGARERPRLGVAALGQEVVGARPAGEGRLLAGRPDRGRGLGQRGAGLAGERDGAAEVAREQGQVGAEVQVEHPRAEALLPDEAGAGVLARALQVVHGGVEVVLHQRPVGGHRVRHLHRGLPVEVRRVGQHAAEHGHVHRGVGAALQVGVARRRPARRHALGRLQRRRPLLRPHERELLDPRGVVVVLGLEFAEQRGDVPRGPQRGRLRDAARDEVVAHRLAQALGALG
jgi:hypothetical protein